MVVSSKKQSKESDTKQLLHSVTIVAAENIKVPDSVTFLGN